MGAGKSWSKRKLGNYSAGLREMSCLRRQKTRYLHKIQFCCVFAFACSVMFYKQEDRIACFLSTKKNELLQA